MTLETKISGLNKPVSRILLGTTGRDFSAGAPPLELLDAAFELGVRTLDTARGYTGAEKSLGKWIHSRGNRDQLVILTKCCHPGPFGKKRVSAEWMKKELDRSLRDLQTDYVDILLLHRDDPDVEVAELVETFNELKAQGMQNNCWRKLKILWASPIPPSTPLTSANATFNTLSVYYYNISLSSLAIFLSRT